jgi:hypothetical protein
MHQSKFKILFYNKEKKLILTFKNKNMHFMI